MTDGINLTSRCMEMKTCDAADVKLDEADVKLNIFDAGSYIATSGCTWLT